MSLSSKARRKSGPTIHRALLAIGVMFLLPQIVRAEGQLCFDGVDDRVMVPFDSSFPTETFTIMAWIKLPTPTRRSAIIARGEDDNSFNLSWQLYVSPDGLLEIMLEDANENNFCYPNTCMGQPQASCVAGDRFVGDDQWHHVAGTRNASGELVLYVDGQVVTTCQQTGIPSSNNFQFLTIGCTHGTIGPPPGGMEPPIWFFAGLIDEPAMWNVALTGIEIEEVYLNGVNPGSPGLVGYWSFDEGSGQVVGDLSTSGNDGFLGANSNPDGDDADPTWVVSNSCDCPGGVCGCDIPDTDTDGDNTPDCNDQCPNEPALVNPSEPGAELTCDDAVDNDCDGLTDAADPDCAAGCPFTCGDINGSGGLVNLEDFATFAGCFNTVVAPGCECSDLTGNGVINLEDFATFSLNFGGASTNVLPNCP